MYFLLALIPLERSWVIVLWLGLLLATLGLTFVVLLAALVLAERNGRFLSRWGLFGPPVVAPSFQGEEPLQANLTVARLRNGGMCELALQNNSSEAISCAIEAKAESSAVQFGLPPNDVLLEPGQKTAVRLGIGTEQRPFLGLGRVYPFTLHVQASHQTDPLVRRGQLEITPVIPVWLPSLVSLCLLGVCVLAAFATNYALNTANASVTVTAQANLAATRAAAASTAVAVAETIPPTVRPPTAVPTLIPNPSSCAQVLQQSPGATDGEYVLYLHGDATRPFLIYCYNMAGQPVEYLSLANPNYALISYPEGALITQYSKIRLNPSSLIVDRTDRTFATFPGEAAGYQSLSGEGYPVQVSDYGRAEGCNRADPNAPVGQAVIDLSGLPFQVSAEVVFEGSGNEMSQQVTDISPDRKVVTLTVNGRCAHSQPITPLTLVYVPPG